MTQSEQKTLVAAVGGEFVAGGKLKSSYGWANDGNGTDEFGFSVLPVGWYVKNNKGFVEKDSAVVFWSVTDSPIEPAYSTIDYRFDFRRDVYQVPSEKNLIADPVRCLKD